MRPSPLPRSTVIAHFYNEEFLLPFWLNHHYGLFDHGILVDYASTDASCDIIRDLAPGWAIRRSLNADWDFRSLHREISMIERGVAGYKIVLNITELLVHFDLRGYLAEFEFRHPDAVGVTTSGLIMVDRPADVGRALTDECLLLQRNWGYVESDVAPVTPFNPVLRSRLLHKETTGRYLLGRHRTRHKRVAHDPSLFLAWYGFSPYPQVKKRRLSFAARMSERDIQAGAGFQHLWSSEELDEAFLQESRRSYDLLARVPSYREMILRLQARKVDSKRKIAGSLSGTGNHGSK